ncbi:archaemetzincin [Persephonella hydrogeniphila]|uniref:Archaemetzincin n=1 Tax=Persephonella hydrogeniphila TaxID=198703 RepID=A0A285NC77_9AQUI|nr:archaemetzincin family Zn-dependent metalloprotease [Persephonella hydrogeniphila]SNZ06888.1 archaemetzincin [Persephonella hydrogeniphila]
MNIRFIRLQPYSPEDNIDKNLLTGRLVEIFKTPVMWNSPVMIPQIAFDNYRNQYLGSYFLKDLLKFKKDNEIILGIVSKDLYEPELNFVFGVASPLTKTAVISTYRLHNSFYGIPENYEIFMDRVTKEAVHEIGHTLGLGHCPNPECVMHFSNSIEDTDRKSYYFCPSCYKKVLSSLGL